MRKLMTLAGASAVALALLVAPSAVASSPQATAAAKTCAKEKRAVKTADGKKAKTKAKKALRKCRKAEKSPKPDTPSPGPAPAPEPAPAPAPVETVLSKEKAHAITDAYARQLFERAVATATTPSSTPVRYQVAPDYNCERLNDRTVVCPFGLYYPSGLPDVSDEIVCINEHTVMLLADGRIEEENDVLGCD